MDNEQTIPTLIKTLHNVTATDGKVLSLYLDISGGRTAREAHLLAFRDLCKEIRPQLPQGEAVPFNATAARVEQELVASPSDGHAGVAIFAMGSSPELHAVALPRRPADALIWDSRPHLEPLQAILDDEERVAIVLFADDQARLFTVFLGKLEEHGVINDDVPRKQKSGGWAALAQSRYARRRDDRLMRHAAHTIAALLEMLRAHPVDRLYVGGPEETRAILVQQLPKPLRSRLAGTLSVGVSATEAEILQAARPVIEADERRAEVATIDELFNAATTRHVVIGASDTLAAVTDSRVYRLLVANTYAQAGGECSTCNRLIVGPGRCPVCGGPTDPIEDLGERAMQLALSQAARVSVVSGDAAALLQTRGGLGAWTRY